MRRVAGSQQSNFQMNGKLHNGSQDAFSMLDGTESVVSMSMSQMSSSSSAVALGVSAMTFEQHSTLIR